MIPVLFVVTVVSLEPPRGVDVCDVRSVSPLSFKRSISSLSNPVVVDVGIISTRASRVFPVSAVSNAAASW